MNHRIGKSHVSLLVIFCVLLFTFLCFISPASASYAEYNYYYSPTNYQWACTWIAWTYARDKGYNFPDTWGNGGTWAGYARAAGYLVDDNPTVDSIACWSVAAAGNNVGHVAYVTAVNPDGSITFHEGGSNWAGSVYGINDRTINRSSTYEGKGLWPDQGFIHLKGSQFEQSIDLVQCPGTNSLRVAGWVFNKENSSASIQVHVYIDAPAGSGTILGGITANLPSDTVNQIHGITGKHRFDYTFTNVPGGNHTFYFYAVDGDKNDTLGRDYTRSLFIDFKGSDPVLPDGDYLIVSAATTDKDNFYYLDILGTEVTTQTNVQLHGPSNGNVSAYEAWTVKYNSSDKFYTISQKTNPNMCLDVQNGDANSDIQITAAVANNSAAQKWTIEKNGTSGYMLLPKCGASTPMCMDLQNTNIASGGRIRTWPKNNSAAQSWLFIPYKPAQPIENGRYVLLYDADKTYELDIPGDTGDVGDVQVQLWTNDALSQFNSFDFTKLDNGYYKVKHVASGKCLEVKEGSSSYGSVVRLWADNGVLTQQWAIIPNGTGYNLIARSNGYALDLPAGATGKGKLLESYPQMNNNNQRWSFVKAEYSIKFNADDAESGVPATITKYYRKEITIPNQTPVREGYRFVCWADQSSEGNQYDPGDSITADTDMELTAVWEEEEVEDNLTWTLEGDVLSISGIGKMKNYTQQNQAPWRFQSGNVKKIKISEGVTSIGSYAFVYMTSLTEVMIPSTIQSIGENAFMGCFALAEVHYDAYYDNWNKIAISETGNSSLTEATIYGWGGVLKAGICGESLSWNMNGFTLTITGAGEIDDYDPSGAPWYAFREYVYEIILPDGITRIGEYAFAECGVEEITLPASLKTIGNGAFKDCSWLESAEYGDAEENWRKVSVGSGNEYLLCATITFVKTEGNITSEVVNGVLTISGTGPMQAYNYRSTFGYAITPWSGRAAEIQKIVIEDGVTAIGAWAFAGLVNVTDVDIGEGVIRIGAGAFYNCSGLTGITIPDQVQYLEENAFCQCTGLLNVDLPAGLLNIGPYAFEHCESLSEVVFPSNLRFIRTSAFRYCPNLKRITLGANLKEIGLNAFLESGIQTITIPEGVATKVWPVFYAAEQMRLYCITLPASLTDLGFCAFYNTDLPYENPDIITPNGLKTIESEAMFGTAAVYVWLNDNVEFVGDNAFAECRNLKYVYVPSSGITVSPSAFPKGTIILGKPSEPDRPSYAEDFANENGYTFVPLEPYGSNG